MKECLETLNQDVFTLSSVGSIGEIKTVKRPGRIDESYFKINFNGKEVFTDQIRFNTPNPDTPALTIFTEGTKQIHANLEDVEHMLIKVKKTTELK